MDRKTDTRLKTLPATSLAGGTISVMFAHDKIETVHELQCVKRKPVKSPGKSLNVDHA